MTGQPNANQKLAHLATGGAMTQEADDSRAVALCDVVLRGVEQFDFPPPGFDLCETCQAEARELAEKNPKFAGTSVVVGEIADAEPAALEVGGTEIESSEPAAPPTVSAPLTLEIEDAEPSGVVNCPDCWRMIPLSVDGGNHVFGGDVPPRPCGVAFNFEGRDVEGPMKFAARAARATKVAFVIYRVEGSAGVGTPSDAFT